MKLQGNSFTPSPVVNISPRHWSNPQRKNNIVIPEPPAIAGRNAIGKQTPSGIVLHAMARQHEELLHLFPLEPEVLASLICRPILHRCIQGTNNSGRIEVEQPVATIRSFLHHVGGKFFAVVAFAQQPHFVNALPCGCNVAVFCFFRESLDIAKCPHHFGNPFACDVRRLPLVNNARRILGLVYDLDFSEGTGHCFSGWIG